MSISEVNGPAGTLNGRRAIPQLAHLPAPPFGKTGWPWTEKSPSLPRARPDGSPWPRISIVTPSYNQGQFIEETIRSVLLQDYPNSEYIVIDGGSTDESIEIIKKYAPWLAYWVSEKDRCQAHAINKGIEHVTGDVFNWINSDDFLLPGSLGKIGLLSDPDFVVAAAVLNFSDKGSELIFNRFLTADSMITGTKATFHQPGLWLRTRNLQDVGPIEETLDYAFDHHLITKYLSLYPNVRYTNEIVVNFRHHTLSKTCSQGAHFQQDRRLAFSKILSDPRYENLHRLCADRLHWEAWADRIMTIRASRRPAFVTAVQLLIEAARHPRVRLTRYTLGAVRQSLFS